MTIPALQISQPLQVYLKSVTSDALGKGLVVGGNHRCAATGRGRGERGKADELGAEVCARSRNKAIPGSRVQASGSSRSGPLDQEVKTRLILELVTGSEVHRWAGTSETK